MPDSQEPFEGFDRPFYTQVPDAIFDRFLPDLTGAELKVLLYICRRTFGFKKTNDDISITQLMKGIVRHSGVPLDYGTGLSRDSVTRATRSLEERGLIIRSRNSNGRQGDLATTYRLKMRGEQGVDRGSIGGSIETPEGGVRKSDAGVSENRTGPVREADTQETVIQETEEIFEFERFLQDFAHEFKDRAPLSSSRTRLRKLYEESGLSRDDFMALMYLARTRTKRATKIRNRFAYWLEVIENELSTTGSRPPS